MRPRGNLGSKIFPTTLDNYKHIFLYFHQLDAISLTQHWMAEPENSSSNSPPRKSIKSGKAGWGEREEKFLLITYLSCFCPEKKISFYFPPKARFKNLTEHFSLIVVVFFFH